MGLTHASLTAPASFLELTHSLLGLISGGNGRLPQARALLRENRGYLQMALSLAAPLPTDGTPYSRHVIFSGSLGDLMVATWAPGSLCLPHDHGEAHGVVTPLKGEFFEQNYHLSDSAFAPVGEAQVFRPGGFRVVEPGEIHSLRALGEGVTLHLYAPPVRGMKVYDEASRTIYTVADNCGAWIPADSALILRREALFGGDSLHH